MHERISGLSTGRGVQMSIRSDGATIRLDSSNYGGQYPS